MHEERQNRRAAALRALACALQALCLVGAFNRYFFRNTAFSAFNDRPFHASSILNVFLFAAGWLLFHRAWEADRRSRRFSALYGVVTAGALVLGRSLYLTDRLASAFVPAENLLSSVVVFVGFASLIAAVCAVLLPLLEDERFPAGPEGKSRFLIFWGVIFLAWLPALLAYWPGVHSYDAWVQTPQALGPITDCSRLHPPLHTLFWALCIRAGKASGVNPLTLYAVVQMLAVSAIFARVTDTMRRLRVNRFLVLGALAWFALNPALAIFSLTMTKDVFFGALLLLLFVKSILLVRDPAGFLHDKRAAAGFVLSGALTLLLRNNALYMLLLAAPFFLIVLRRQLGRTALLLALTLGLFWVVNGPVYDALGIQPAWETEALCVPLSQMANTVLNDRDTLEGEELEAIDRYFPTDRIEEIYNPRFADYIKYNFDQAAYYRDRGAFFRLWLSLFPKHASSYLCAFLDLNLPYWYPDAATVDYWSGRAYIEVENTGTDAFSVERDSRLPRLLRFYDSVADFSAFENRPLLNTLFSIATPVWLLLFCAAVLGWKKRWSLLLPLSLPFFLWATYMAGPVSNFRYVEPLFAMYPVWISMALQPGRWLDKGGATCQKA
ncbi:MAG: DUF6020 family protein [Eubacteriales bacterium]|nr:DUF6020 family protein [Eubacteriales bacterium]